jgi:hypothetical protein
MDLRQTKVRQIGDTTYEITQLGALAGSKIFMKVLKSAYQAKSSSEMLANMAPEDFDALIAAFGPMTNVVGKGPLDKIFDFHFVGRYDEMLQWISFCIDLNFARPSPKAPSATAGIPTQAPQQPETVQTGSSGVS